VENLTLNCSLSGNVVLNTDGLTLLRTLRVVQNDVYSVALNFLNGDTPDIQDFRFDLRNPGGVNLVSVTGITGLPYAFTLDLTNPALINNLEALNLKGFLNYSTFSGITSFSPFGVRMTSNPSGGGALQSYVQSLNGLSGIVGITGLGNVSVSQNGQTIGVFCDTTPFALESDLLASGNALNGSISALQSQTGNYYPSSNPSGFSTVSALAQASGSLQTEISTLQAATGAYASIPFVTGASGILQGEIGVNSSAISVLQGQTGNYSTIAFTTGISGALQTAINLNSASISTLNGITGSFYLSSNPSHYLPSGNLNSYVTWDSRQLLNASELTSIDWQNCIFNDAIGTQSLNYNNRVLADSNGISVLNWTIRDLFDSNGNNSILFDNRFLIDGNGALALNYAGRQLSSNSPAVTLDWQNEILSGNWQCNTSSSAPFSLVNFQRLSGLSGVLESGISGLQANTGFYYLTTNPSGYITSSDLSFLQAATGILQSEISTLSAATGSYYPGANPSGYITSSALAPYATLLNLASTSGVLQSQISAVQTETGILSSSVASLVAATGGYYPITNPSGYTPTGFVTGISGVLQSEITAIQALTGSFATTGFVTGISGVLQTEINTLQNSTGILNSSITGASGVLQAEIATLQSNTGTYYLKTNPSGYASTGFITGVSGALNTSITNLSGAIGTNIHWQSEQLIDSLPSISVDWGNRYLYDSSHDVSVSWQSRITADSSSTTSIDWQNRLLDDSSANTSVDYGNRILSGNWQTNATGTGSTIVNYNALTGASGALQTEISSIQSNPSGFLNWPTFWPTGLGTGLVIKQNANSLYVYNATSSISRNSTYGFWRWPSGALSAGLPNGASWALDFSPAYPGNNGQPQAGLITTTSISPYYSFNFQVWPYGMVCFGNYGSNLLGMATYPSMILSTGHAFNDGDSVTDGLGAGGIVVSTSGNYASFRWLTGTQSFTNGQTVIRNGVALTGITFTSNNYGMPNGSTNHGLVYMGGPNSGNYGFCWWNQSQAADYPCLEMRW